MEILIDGTSYEVKEGRNLLETCLELGFNVPYFCWHPAMGSVGACRQCAIKEFKDEHDTHGKLVMACMTPAAPGARVSIEDAEARAFRKSIIEWLMLNHPHDCPICDEGGECHLQDMTVMTGHVYRRTRFKKRTFRNQNLGPFVNHEMNRCITCYRCVRFYNDYAGGRDFGVFAAHDHAYFGRHEDGILESEFSGNLIEVCPTGVFTDKTFKKHYTRKWDLQTAPSVCAHCSLGCNTIPAERYGQLRRIRNRYHSEINGYFLCDRGRYGYEFVNGERRIRKAWNKGPGNPLERLGELIGNPEALSRTIGIASPRATLESGFALKRLVGERNFYSGFSERESRLVSLVLQVMKEGPASSPNLHEIERADALFILGEDLPNTAPRMSLSVRQAARNASMSLVRELKIPEWLDSAVRETAQGEKTPIFQATPYSTRLDDIALESYFAAPDDLARLGFAVARAIDPEAPAVDGLPAPIARLAQSIADSLKSAASPTIISGTGSTSVAVIQAAANIARALNKQGRKPRLSFVLPECNTLGAGLLRGKDLNEAFEAVKQGRVDTVIVVENDLYRRANAQAVDDFLNSIQQLILIDSIASGMVPRAGLLLPAASFAESSGTYVNNEGRAQRLFRVFNPKDDVRESWRWLGWERLDDVLAGLAESGDAALLAAKDAAPSADYRMAGQRIPRQPHRSSGRTSIHADVSVHEPQPPEDPDSPLSFSMEGAEEQPPSALVPRFWAPGWNSIQALNRFQSEISGPLRGGPAGVRLIEAAGEEDQLGYFLEIPGPFRARPESFLVIPIHHVFGSEETSALSEAIAERIPKAYITLSPADATRIGCKEGDGMELSLFPGRRDIGLRVDQSLVQGTIGVPFGLQKMRIGAEEALTRCEVSKARMERTAG